MAGVVLLLLAAGQPPRTDPYGGLLPKGAISRFGTMRFRDGAGSDSPLISARS